MSEKMMCSAVLAVANAKSYAACENLKALCDSDIIDEVIVVTAEENIDYCTEELVRKNGFDKVDGIVIGADTYEESVRAGLMVCDIASDYVFICDDAGGTLTKTVIQKGYESALKCGAASADEEQKMLLSIYKIEEIVRAQFDLRKISLERFENQ